MVHDTERCLVAVKNEFIFLSVKQNIVLNLLITNKNNGIYGEKIKEFMYPYNENIYHIIMELRKKLSKYLYIVTENKKYKIYIKKYKGGKLNEYNRKDNDF